MKTLFTFLFLAVATTCFAQKKQNVYFLKNDGRYVDAKDSADFIRIVSEPDSGTQLYNITEFYKSGIRKLAAKSLTIDPPKFEGMSISNYETGNRRSIKNYKNNLLVGEQYEFFPNGKVYIIKSYSGNITPPLNIGQFKITANYDSLGTALVTDGNGYYKGYDKSFKKIVEEGTIKNGEPDGEWKYQDSLGTRVESYTNGKFISGTFTNTLGETTNYTIRETLPEFPGGPQAFSQYLARKIIYPREDREKNIQGAVILTFVVEKDGKLSDIKILRHVSPAIDAEAVRVFKASPTWKPGYQFGKPVRAHFTQSVSFSLAMVN